MKIDAILWSRQNKNNKHYIKIRITENRKSTYINLNYDIQKRYWNENTHRVRSSYKDYEKINKLIEKEILKYTNDGNEVKLKDLSFLQYFNDYIDIMKEEYRVSDYKKHKVIRNHLVEFTKTKYKRNDILFDDITITYLKNLKVYFIRKGHNNNTIKYNFSKIKQFYNQAIKEGLHKIETNPFDFVKIKKIETSNKGLTLDEFLTLDIINTFFYKDIVKDFDSKKLFFIKNYFLLQFFSNGMRVSDLLMLRWSNINDGYLEYKMRKTQKHIKMKLNERLIEILRFFLPFQHKIIRLKKYPDDIELYMSLSDTEKKYFDKINPSLKNIKFNKNAFYSYNLIDHKNLVVMYNGVSNDNRYKNNFIINIFSQKDIEILNNKNNKNIIFNTHKIIQSNTTKYNKELKNLIPYIVSNDVVLSTNLTTHSARHTYAGVMVSKATNLKLLSRGLGHSKIETTENYIKSITNDSVYDEINKSFDLIKEDKKQLLKKTKDIIISVENKDGIKYINKPNETNIKFDLTNQDIIFYGTLFIKNKKLQIVKNDGKIKEFSNSNNIIKYNNVENSFVGTIYIQSNIHHLLYPNGKTIKFKLVID